MRLPGTRYQEHGWEQVRKLLGHCSLQAFRRIEMHQMLEPSPHAELLDSYTDAVAAAAIVAPCTPILSPNSPYATGASAPDAIVPV